MTNARKLARRSTRTAFIASVSAAALAGPALAGGPLQAYSGNISAFNGNISAFTGNISAFTGNISAFTGNISAFTGNISAFGGNISAFNGNISAFNGVVDPFWGNISAFSNTLGSGVAGSGLNYAGVGDYFTAANTQWSALSPAWQGVTDKSSKITLTALSAQFKALEATSATFWGSAVQAQTGKSFYDGFAKGLYAKYGFDPNNTSSLSKVSTVNRNLFILDWYDGLMSFTGTDHVDWWMKSANWSPAITQTQGSGGAATIGLLDFQITSAAVAQGDLVNIKGVSNYSNGHGAAVASLMVAPHDGKGIMGIAPQASVVAYNPFDSSGTTNWTDVTTGVGKLVTTAGVLNLSLGVPGYTLSPDWKKVFTDPKVTPYLANTVFVVAAGNDGVTQNAAADVGAAVKSLLVVGSIGPTDVISDFSNRPGTTCLAGGPACPSGSRLMDRFVVAPGELVLVDDGNGGFTRKVGTSFAAPLVTGAVALLQDRWPWLKNYPAETTSIILKSARDLGAAGVDAVYGVGALDVTASQSPLSFDALKFYTLDKSGKLVQQDTARVRTTTEAQLAQYDTAGLFYYGYETVGGTYRDFAIPLSSKLVGQSVMSAGGTQEQFQGYIYSRMTDWMGGGTGVVHEATGPAGGPAPAPGPGPKYRFAAAGDDHVALANPWGLNLSFAARPWSSQTLGYRASSMPMQTDMRLASKDGRQTLRFGYGDGASALSGLSGLGLATDSNAGLGGANPVLGLASGGGYAHMSTALTDRLSFSAGYSQRRTRLDLNQLSSPDRLAMKDMADYRASADHMGVSYAAAPGLQLTAGYTHLSEPNAMLGVRSVDPTDFAGGSRTDAATFGLEWKPSEFLRVSGSATMGRTADAGGSDRNFATADGGLKSTAYEVAVDKLGVLDGADRLRLTLSQPLTVEAGKLAYTSVQVVDRSTGQLGAVTQMISAQTPERRYVAEMLYGHDVGHGAGEWGLFGRVESRSQFTVSDAPALMAGARFRISY